MIQPRKLTNNATIATAPGMPGGKGVSGNAPSDKPACSIRPADVATLTAYQGRGIVSAAHPAPAKSMADDIHHQYASDMVRLRDNEEHARSMRLAHRCVK